MAFPSFSWHCSVVIQVSTGDANSARFPLIPREILPWATLGSSHARTLLISCLYHPNGMLYVSAAVFPILQSPSTLFLCLSFSAFMKVSARLNTMLAVSCSTLLFVLFSLCFISLSTSRLSPGFLRYQYQPKRSNSVHRFEPKDYNSFSKNPREWKKICKTIKSKLLVIFRRMIFWKTS